MISIEKSKDYCNACTDFNKESNEKVFEINIGKSNHSTCIRVCEKCLTELYCKLEKYMMLGKDK